MQDFSGKLYLQDDPDTILDAKVTVDLNEVTVFGDNTEIGSWRHADVIIRPIREEIYLTADGETLVLQLDGSDFFLDLLGVEKESKRKSRRRRREETSFEAEKLAPMSLADPKAAAREATADRVDKRVAIAMAVASVVLLVGAALTWGPFRLFEPGSFPIARLLAGFGGLGGLLALYLAYFDRSRTQGAAAAIAAGFVTFCIIFLYMRAARLGIGFILALLGAQALITAGVLGMMNRPPGD